MYITEVRQNRRTESATKPSHREDDKTVAQKARQNRRTESATKPSHRKCDKTVAQLDNALTNIV